MKLGPVGAWVGGLTVAPAEVGRGALALGVSHPQPVDPRWHVYERLVQRMRTYLEAMDDPFVPATYRTLGSAFTELTGVASSTLVT